MPSAALSSIELAVSGSGVPAVGFFAQVPHYVGGPWAPATIALIEHLGRHLQIDLTVGGLGEDAIAQRARVDALMEEQDDAREYLERLEGLPGEGGMPSGDDLASEIERFLRENES